MTHAQLLDAHVSPACIFSYTTVVSVIIICVLNLTM